MHLGWTAEQLEIRLRYQMIGESRGARGTPMASGFDVEGWQLICAEGIWRMVIPPAFGGTGEAWWDFTAALEGLASTIRRPGLLLSVIAQAGMIRALMLCGSEQQRAKYFSAILSGRISATAIAEPGTGTDVRGISTMLQEGEGHYLLNGAKFNIAHAPIADFFLVVTKSAELGPNATTLVLIDREQVGASFGNPDKKLGNDDLPTGSIRFADAPIRQDQVLGVPGRGLRDLIAIISLGRLYYGLIAANVILPFLNDAIGFSAKRTSFDQTISAHQYVQGRLVDIKIGVERSKWTAYGALHQLLSDDPEAIMSCSIAKLVGADDLVNGANSLLRLFGSLGYQAGAISNFLRDALGFSSVGGTEEMHRKNIFNQITRASVTTP